MYLHVMFFLTRRGQNDAAFLNFFADVYGRWQQEIRTFQMTSFVEGLLSSGAEMSTAAFI